MTPPHGGTIPYQPPLPDWALPVLRQPLPRAVRPVRDETLDSYLSRLAWANGLNPYYFGEYVRGSKRTSVPVPPDVLVTLSGQPATSMRYAILELCTPEELAVMKVAGRPRPGNSRTGAMCTRCTRARGIYDPVTCWMRTEDVICLPHRRWITGTGQVDLAAHRDIIQANKRHRRLIRQHGRDAARRAFGQASRIVGEWAVRNTYSSRFNEHMKRFHGSAWSASLEHCTVLASLYVPAVALVRLLASPGWQAPAFHPEGNARFVAEVRRTVEPAYRWNPYPYWRYIEPLARTLIDEREFNVHPGAVSGTGRNYRIPLSPPRRGETIESDELHQPA